ncbi:MAG: nuclear transport factor 2 family protein [Acidobacteriota bacterium]
MEPTTPSPARQLLAYAYAAFNARDIPAALSAMHPDVEWSNGMEGGKVHGRDEVGAYWTRQWTSVDPHVDPLRIDDDDDGHLIVAVHQIVRNLAGLVVAERFVEHAYLVEDGLIRRMEIRPVEHKADRFTS